MITRMESHGLENLATNQFIGVVIDTDDPESCGRCRVRVFHLMNDIEDPYIPWAAPKYNSSFGSYGGGSVSVPKVGTVVGVEFNCGDIYSPEYYGIANADAKMVDNIKHDYPGANVLASDSDNSFSLFYQQAAGFSANLKGSVMGINADSSISLEHNNGTSNIELQDNKVNIVSNNDINIGGDANKVVNLKSDLVKIDGTQGLEIKGSKPDEYAVNANALLTLLEGLAKMIDIKAPASPGGAETLVKSMRHAVINNKIRYT